jgi:1-aminocyclopropane-1-carboxylate deaminase/D-cysteine desulfhydrase-like pyridoxal-dependent ACC family enzyme
LAAAGAKLGLEVHLTPWQDARSHPIQGNYLLAHLYGAVLHPVPMGASSKEAKAALAARLRAEGRRPYVVGMGAHQALVLAAVAYVDAFLELLAQLPGDNAPDWVFTTSQGSTQAGLLAAARWLGLTTRVVGINPMGPDHEAYSSPDTIHAMVHDALNLLGLPLSVPHEEVQNDTGYVGVKYGVPSPAGLAALHRLARSEGITLDPVYTSKGFSGLLDYVERGRVRSGERVVFIHTGGLPGLFAYNNDLVEVGA